MIVRKCAVSTVGRHKGWCGNFLPDHSRWFQKSGKGFFEPRTVSLATSEQAHLRAMFPGGLEVPELDALDNPRSTRQINGRGLAAGKNAIADHELFAGAVDEVDNGPVKEDRSVVAHTHAQRAERSVAPLHEDMVVILSTIDEGLAQKVPTFSVVRKGRRKSAQKDKEQTYGPNSVSFRNPWSLLPPLSFHTEKLSFGPS